MPNFAKTPEDPNERRVRLITWAAASACVLLIIWMGAGWDQLVSRDTYVGKKFDYYSLLVHGMAKGHLYMDTGNDPLLDASYYNGRYYLYFGVAPAALFLLPYAWLTGNDLQPRLVVVVGALAGFLFSVEILRMAAKDFFKRSRASFNVAAVAVLAFATGVPLLLTRAMFYEVAVATGYAFTMAGLFWTYRAMFGNGRSWPQFALASTAFALGVGCRPDLVLNLPAVVAAALFCGWRLRDRTPSARVLHRMVLASVAPATLVGGLLAVYNYERFGNPLEFGMTYSQNEFIGDAHRLFSSSYLWPNLHWYYLTGPSLSPFFPYVFPEEAYFGPPDYPGGEAIHGQSVVFLLLALVVTSALLARKRLQIGRLAPYLFLLTWMFGVLLLAVCALGVRADRYMVDFQPALALGIVLLAGATMAVPSTSAVSGMFRIGFMVLVALSAAFNIFAGLQEFETFKNTRNSTFRALETWGDQPAGWLERNGLLAAGPVELKVIFPQNRKDAAIEPLLVAGTPDRTDSLYVVEWPGGGKIEFQADHSGFGGPRSEVLTIEPGRAYTVTVDMGGLYPPLCPPFSGDFGSRQVKLLKTGIRVKMDGNTVLNRKMNSYDAPPWTLEVGRNDITMNPFKTEFTGRVLSLKRLPPPRLLDDHHTGLCRIRCVFPMEYPNKSFPLLSMGDTGSGTLVYVSVLPNNRIRFGADEWSIGGGVSETLVSTPQSVHLVEILIGSLVAGEKWPPEWGIPNHKVRGLEHSLRIWLDGRPVWATALTHPLDQLDPMFDIGTNHQGFSTAQPDFGGTITDDPYTPKEAREFLERNLEAPQ